MVIECDICGFQNSGKLNFCGGCGVDMREQKKPGEPKIVPAKVLPRKKGKGSSKDRKPENEKVIHWCAIHSACSSFNMTFPLFLTVVFLLAKGDKTLGFCDCPVCNQGYRELQAWIRNGTENTKLTANCREIVIEARNEKIDGMDFDISKIIENVKEKNIEKSAPERADLPARKSAGGKIIVEIDSDVLEDAVFNVMRSERGQEVIRSTPRKRKNMREAGVVTGSSMLKRSNFS